MTQPGSRFRDRIRDLATRPPLSGSLAFLGSLVGCYWLAALVDRFFFFAEFAVGERLAIATVVAGIVGPAAALWARAARRGAVTGSEKIVFGDIPQRPAAFQPRSRLLEDIRRKLTADDTATVVALIGPIGVGKTNAAAALAGRFAESPETRLVSWVSARTTNSVIVGLSELAERLGRRAEGDQPSTAARRVREWLEDDGTGCLLVLDGAATPADVQPWLPFRGAAKVVVTTSSQAFADMSAAVLPVDVEVFEPTEASDYLIARTGRTDPAGAMSVAEALGRLPLALAQAAAVINQDDLTYGEYLDRLKSLPLEDLLPRAEGDRYPESTPKALLLGVRAVEGQSEDVWRVAEVISLLDGAGVRSDLLRGDLARRSVPLDPHTVDHAVRALKAASLTDTHRQHAAEPDTEPRRGGRGRETVAMHRLMRRAVREHAISEGTFVDAVRRTVTLLERSLPSSPRSDRQTWEHLVAQIEALRRAVADVEEVTNDRRLARRLLKLSQAAGLYLSEVNDRDRALPNLRTTVEESERVLGADDPDTERSREYLAEAEGTERDLLSSRWIRRLAVLIGVLLVAAVATAFVAIGDLRLADVRRGGWVPVIAAVAVGGLGVLALLGLRAGHPLTDVPADPPAGLPPVPYPFVGRQRELSQFRTALAGRPAAVIHGSARAGTSAFGLLVAHSVRDSYPGGQVYVDARGAGDHRSLTAGGVLASVLHRLGRPAPLSARPEDLAAAARSLRQWLVQRRVLVLVDNVDRPDQVDHVIEGVEGSLVLIVCGFDPRSEHTARESPGGERSIPSTVPTCSLGPITQDEAIRLLTATSGRDHRDLREDPSTATLVAYLYHRPLALAIAGGLLRDRELDPAQLVELLTRSSSSSGPADGILPLAEIAVQEMRPPARRLFRLLALVPATELDARAAASLAGGRGKPARRALREMSRHWLVEPASSRRYRIRQELMPLARTMLQADEGPRRRETAEARLARHFAGAAGRWADTLTIDRAADRERERLRAAAGHWFHREHELLFRLVVDGWSPQAADRPHRATAKSQPHLVRVAVALCRWYAREPQPVAWDAVCRSVLTMTTADEKVTAWAHNELAVLARRRGEFDQAWTHLRDAADRATGHGDQPDTYPAQISTNCGVVLLERGDPDDAVTYLRRARQERARGDRGGRARTDLALGAAQTQREGKADRAEDILSAAANTFHSLGDVRGLAAADNAQGLACWERDEWEQANDCWERSAEEFAEVNDDLGVAAVRLNQASAHLLEYEQGVGVPTAEATLSQIIEELHTSLELRTAAGQWAGSNLALVHMRLGDAYMHLAAVRRESGRSADQEDAKRRDHWERASKAVGVPADVAGARAHRPSSCARIAQELARRLAHQS